MEKKDGKKRRMCLLHKHEGSFSSHGKVIIRGICIGAGEFFQWAVSLG